MVLQAYTIQESCVLYLSRNGNRAQTKHGRVRIPAGIPNKATDEAMKVKFKVHLKFQSGDDVKNLEH